MKQEPQNLKTFPKYPDAEEYLLKNISFKANRGETVAFIGSTGSGKSTLINLIPRFYDVSEGSVLVDGVDVREYNQEFLRNKLGYVPQKAVMFDGTVASNVSYGDNGKGDITREKVIEAIRVAQGTEFVEKMDEKYKTVLILRFFEDMTLQEIADTLQENINTVKSRLYRALSLLKIELEEIS